MTLVPSINAISHCRACWVLKTAQQKQESVTSWSAIPCDHKSILLTFRPTQRHPPLIWMAILLVNTQRPFWSPSFHFNAQFAQYPLITSHSASVYLNTKRSVQSTGQTAQHGAPNHSETQNEVSASLFPFSVATFKIM